MKILILSFTIKDLYHDGFKKAIDLLSKKYELDFCKTHFDGQQRHFANYDIVLLKSGFGAHRSLVESIKAQNVKVGLIISTIDKPSLWEFDLYDVLFYETAWYKNYAHLARHPLAIHAFGVDTDIMHPNNNQLKEYDILSVGTFIPAKRLTKIISQPGRRIVLGNYYGRENSIVRKLKKSGVEVKDAVSYEELADYYNKSKLCYVPCRIDGGGERCVLEARACGISVRIEDDNPKLKELAEGPIYDHIYYASQLENGILKSLNKMDQLRFNKWFIGYKRRDDDLFSFRNYKVIFPKGRRYFADPFVIRYKNHSYMFFEDYDYRKGRIAYIDLSDDKEIPTVVLEKDYHMSYPFIFEDNGELFMIPETSQVKRIELYECQEFPALWKLKTVLINSIDASDTTLLRYNEKYWLFTTVKNKNDRLTIYYTDELLSCSWRLHPYSISNESKRCAGRIFVQNDELFRPAQDCSKHYGYALIIYRIVELDESKFVEEEVKRIEPTWYPNLIGTHTINFNEDYVVFDGKTRVVEPEAEESTRAGGIDRYGVTRQLKKRWTAFFRKALGSS